MTAILFHVLALNLRIDTVQKFKCKCLFIFIGSLLSIFPQSAWLVELFVLQSYMNSYLIRLINCEKPKIYTTLSKNRKTPCINNSI